MKRRLIACMLACCLIPVTGVFAQNRVDKVLSESDLRKFIADFKPMMAEFEALGVAYEGESESWDNVSDVITALRANSDVNRIVRRYGWDDRFFASYGVILSGYVALKMEAALVELEKGFRESLASIEASPDLTREQKDQLKAQMSSALNSYGEDDTASWRESVHPDDLRLIEKYEGELDVLFENESGYESDDPDAVSGATED